MACSRCCTTETVTGSTISGKLSSHSSPRTGQVRPRRLIPSIMARPVQVHIIGASGRTGAALCAALLAGKVPVVPVVRDAAKWAASGIDATPRIADLTEPEALRSALHDATRIV